MTAAKYDVLGIGNAIFDVLVQTDERFLSRHDMTKGGFEAGSGFGFGLVEGVLFSLVLVSVLPTVPGAGRVSVSDAQPTRESAAPSRAAEI